MIVFLMLLLGLFLIFLEFYLPGAILGICGGVVIFASILVFANTSTSLVAVVGYVILCLASVGGVIKLAIWRIRAAKPEQSIYSEDSQTGYQASRYDREAIGKVGTASTDLKPGGYILVDGKRQQAISQAGYITKGTQVLVVGGQEESLIVKMQKPKEAQ